MIGFHEVLPATQLVPGTQSPSARKLGREAEGEAFGALLLAMQGGTWVQSSTQQAELGFQAEQELLVSYGDLDGSAPVFSVAPDQGFQANPLVEPFTNPLEDTPAGYQEGGEANGPRIMGGRTDTGSVARDREEAKDIPGPWSPPEATSAEGADLGDSRGLILAPEGRETLREATIKTSSETTSEKSSVTLSETPSETLGVTLDETPKAVTATQQSASSASHRAVLDKAAAPARSVTRSLGEGIRGTPWSLVPDEWGPGLAHEPHGLLGQGIKGTLADTPEIARGRVTVDASVTLESGERTLLEDAVGPQETYGLQKSAGLQGTAGFQETAVEPPPPIVAKEALAVESDGEEQVRPKDEEGVKAPQEAAKSSQVRAEVGVQLTDVQGISTRTATETPRVMEAKVSSRVFVDRLVEEARLSLPRTLEMRLSPPGLGTVTVTLFQKGRQVLVRMETMTEDARRVLSQGQTELHEALAKEGLDLLQFSVDGGSAGGAGDRHQAQRRAQRRRAVEAVSKDRFQGFRYSAVLDYLA